MTEQKDKKSSEKSSNNLDYNPIDERIIAFKFGKFKNKSMLDIGTGKGYTAILAAKKFRCRVTTIDKSEEKIKLAKRNAKKEKAIECITFRVCDARDLPFEDNSFDVVFSFNALHHDKKNFLIILREMSRVAKETIVVTELNKNGARLFDEKIHPEENHGKMIVDLNKVETELSKYGKVEKSESDLMTTFVCKNLK